VKKKIDCFAYITVRGKETCGALRAMSCKVCTFYKAKSDTNRETLRLIEEKKRFLEYFGKGGKND